MNSYPRTIQTAVDFEVAYNLDRNRTRREFDAWVQAGGAKVVRLLKANGNFSTTLLELAKAEGFELDSASGQYIPPQPYPSWSWDPEKLQYQPPVPRPDDPWTAWEWDEGGEEWVATGESKQLQSARATARLSRLNFMLRVEEMGFYDQIVAAVSADAVSRRVRILWENAAQFERQHPDLLQMAEELGFSTEDLDTLFDVRGEREAEG